jgi:hypothetical protein
MLAPEATVSPGRPVRAAERTPLTLRPNLNAIALELSDITVPVA